MRLVVISIGRLKQGPERELAERYRERFDDIGRKLGFRGLEIHEIPESRARDAATRITEEAAAISAAIPAKSVLVVLDERGDNIDSAAFARHLGRWRDESVANTIFVIGGADGLSPDLRRKAKLSIAFGAATWPGRDHIGGPPLSPRVSRASGSFGKRRPGFNAGNARHSLLL
jgi:23S rRNA (pseudouridine1915-N3)-methyltransferase